MQDDPHTGFKDWTPQQWVVFFAAAGAFVATVVNVILGNPVGVPFAG